MMIRSALLLSGLIGVGVAASPASHASDAVCLDRKVIADRLASYHQEKPEAAGLASNGQVLEVFTSRNGSWTLVLTDADGSSCVIASGNAWTPLAWASEPNKS